MNFLKKKGTCLLISFINYEYSSYCMGHTSLALWVINEQTMGSWEVMALEGQLAGINKYSKNISKY